MKQKMGQAPAKQSLTKYTDVLKFGKYEGHTVDYIMKREPSYILWLHDDDVCIVDYLILDEALDAHYEIRHEGFYPDDWMEQPF